MGQGDNHLENLGGQCRCHRKEGSESDDPVFQLCSGQAVRLEPMTNVNHKGRRTMPSVPCLFRPSQVLPLLP